MNSAPDTKNPDAETEIWNAINAFERILEVMPDDRTSLDTLVHAYTQLGDQVRARDYLLRLAKVVVDENDKESAESVLELMFPFETDPAAQPLVQRLRLMTNSGAGLPERTEAPAVVSIKPLLTHKTNITDEMSLAWDLLQAGDLTQEQYAEVVQDLSNISSNSQDKGVLSMLHVIEHRGYANMDKILVFASQKGDLPLITLGGFEFSDETISMLPLETMTRHGVLPFDLLGPDALVVLQNPYDLELRKQVELSLGRRCHYYLSSPSEFTSALVRVQKRRLELAAKK